MTRTQPNKVAAITMARNDDFFIRKWVEYYSVQLGVDNLYLILDGHDQTIPEDAKDINVVRVPHVKYNRTQGDRNRARLVSYLAKSLFKRYDNVIAHDVDEILMVDPSLGITLRDFISDLPQKSTYSALGLDVGQHLNIETAIDASKPFLAQRSFAHISSRYTKPVLACQPITWGSGYHRVKWRNFRIHPSLYLLHFGLVDYEMTAEKVKNSPLKESGWEGHFDRRLELFDFITNSKPINGDECFSKSRKIQTWLRPIYALNKPGTQKEQVIIRLPERFKQCGV